MTVFNLWDKNNGIRDYDCPLIVMTTISHSYPILISLLSSPFYPMAISLLSHYHSNTVINQDRGALGALKWLVHEWLYDICAYSSKYGIHNGFIGFLICFDLFLEEYSHSLAYVEEYELEPYVCIP